MMFNEQRIINQWVADMYEKTEIETDDVVFLLSILGKEPKKILEVCCGSGRILVPLAKAGHTVDGIDVDEVMLARISDKARGLGNITWRTADAVHDDWGSGYDVVVLAGNILYNIVTDMNYAKAQELFIQKAVSALVPGGFIYIDYQPGGFSLVHPEKTIGSSGERVVWEGYDREGNYGRMILIGGTYDRETHMDSFIRHFELTMKNGQLITQDISSSKHFATLEQIHGWLSKYGCMIRQEYGDYDCNPIGETTHRAIIYAQKF